LLEWATMAYSHFGFRWCGHDEHLGNRFAGANAGRPTGNR